MKARDSVDNDEEGESETDLVVGVVPPSVAMESSGGGGVAAYSPCGVRKKAYGFDGAGNYHTKEWDLAGGIVSGGGGGEFCWYHVELPKSPAAQSLALSAQFLIDALCPPLKLQDILTLVSNGPFCGHVDGTLFFRVNPPGPAASDFTLRLAARVTESSVVTVSLGRVPRMGFSPAGQSLLSEVPSVETSSSNHRGDEGVVIKEHVLEFLLTMNHAEGADNPVPTSVSELVVHIIDTHVDQIHDMVTKLEMELDTVELELDKGNLLFSFGNGGGSVRDERRRGAMDAAKGGPGAGGRICQGADALYRHPAPSARLLHLPGGVLEVVGVAAAAEDEEELDPQQEVLPHEDRRRMQQQQIPERRLRPDLI